MELSRTDAAKRLNIDPKTLTWWERNGREPFVHAYPAIIRFLESEPWPAPVRLADALLAERRRRGLALKQAAVLIGVDEGTWVRWERGEWHPTGRTITKIDAFLGVDTKEKYAVDVR